MSRWRRVPIRVLVPAVAGLALVTVAFVVETAMGNGTGHRFLVVHIVQLVGSILILLAAVLALVEARRIPR